MPTGDARLVRRLLGLAGAPAGAAPNDGELLDRFVRGGDESAFHEILRRHAPLVLGVCRRVVRQEQDAEDAFQATFLALAQKAGSVRRGASLASWLHGVAYRCAARVRSANARRRRHEGRVRGGPEAPPPDLTWDEVRQALDEELTRLPEKYRAPLVLCYLRGMTQCEAARELGWGTGVLRGRLDRGRERLRARLARRGLALSAGLLAAALASDGAAATLPVALGDATRKAALLVAVGKAVPGVVPGHVAALTKGALQTMLWTKVKVVATCVLTLGALGVGAVLARQTVGAGSAAGRPAGGVDARAASPGRAAPPPRSDGRPDKAETPKAEEKRYEFEMREQPWAKVFKWYADNTGLAHAGNVRLAGSFTFIPPGDKRKYTLEEITDILNEALLAQQYLLVRRTATFTLLPADEKVDPTLVPRVSLGDLEKRGRTALVSVELPLTSVSAKDLGADVKKMLGPFGDVVVLEKGNRLILQDTAGNLRRIAGTIKDIETQEAEKRRDSKRK
jgi:RNA polymerase sigma factor (sigma-70 family)